jgi:hypothetical protein
MISKLESKYTSLSDDEKQVLRMLLTKREIGGSSVKKLETIIDTTYEGRLYDQYVHAGASQSLRTSGRSVQMQNLPRLTTPRDMETLYSDPQSWTNDDLSENLRQLFRSPHSDGQLIVADYGAIESRGLAWLADEEWKLDAYRFGGRIYETLAAKHFNIPVEQVTKDQRMFGKVGELSCGYGAGPVAVRDFAAKMGVELSELEAGDLVRGWRRSNSKTQEFWTKLHDAFTSVVSDKTTTATVEVGPLGGQYYLWFGPNQTPQSLTDVDPHTRSVKVLLWSRGAKDPIMERVFHGCYMDGTNIGYYKPSSLKGGKPWVRSFTNPKTKQQQKYNLYGGKLAGIITQSLCREIFFNGLLLLEEGLSEIDNVNIIGQFHDEVILEWEPGTGELDWVISYVHSMMDHTKVIAGLPMTVDVKHAREYIK